MIGIPNRQPRKRQTRKRQNLKRQTRKRLACEPVWTAVLVLAGLALPAGVGAGQADGRADQAWDQADGRADQAWGPADGRADPAWDQAEVYVRMALEENPGLRAEQAQADLAGAEAGESFGAMLPSLELSSRYSRADGGRAIEIDINDFIPSEIIPNDLPPTVIPFLREEEQETRLTLVQPIFAGGGLYHGWQARRAQHRAARAGLHMAAVDLAFEVRGAYFSYLAARELAQVASEDLAAAREQLRTAEARVAVRSAPESERLLALSALARAQADSTRSHVQVDLARAQCNRLLNRALDHPLDLPGGASGTKTGSEAGGTESPGVDGAAEWSLDQAVSRALSTRADLRRAEEGLDGLAHARKAQRSEYLPTLAAALEYGFQGERYEFDQDSDYYIVSGVLRWSLFDGTSREARRQQARLRERRLEEDRAALAAAVAQEVRASLLRRESGIHEQRAARRAVDAAREAYRMVEALHAEGLSTQLELMDARRTRTRAAAQEVAARYGLLQAQAEVLRSMGYLTEEE